MPCVLNAVNEVAVEAFLNDKVRFLEMSDIVETCLAKMPFIPNPHLNDYVETDNETRIMANQLMQHQSEHYLGYL